MTVLKFKKAEILKIQKARSDFLGGLSFKI